jgi:hypothetical protein
VPSRTSRASATRAFWALVAVVACGLMAAPPAVAAPLPPSENPLPGSSFQGADGNQGDVTSLVDWQGLETARRVIHNPDPNEQDTAFTGGSKQDEPGNWDFTVEPDGVDPPKANILDAWSAVDQGGADAFVYLAFARGGPGITRSGGTTSLTFELNHDSRLWNNGLATIPCRRTGDVLVSYQAQGTAVDVVLERWVTSQSDLASGCATRGHLDPLTGLTPNGDVQGAVNGPEITNYLPGFYGASMPIARFGEAALNLSRILDEALNDECFTFGSIWMHSRSATSDSSNMQDYVAPRAIGARSCAASGTKFHDLDGDGRRDRGEPGLPRWLIWADYDDDGVRDSTEPFGITDSEGKYVINDIRPPDGTYMLRETRRRADRADVTCSFPNAGTPGGTGSAPGGTFPCGWGPIDTATTTYARRRDFGNYASAQLVVKKQLEPGNDRGRFDLLVNGRLALAAAGDGASTRLSVRPGTYTVSEAATAATNPLDYRSTVECKRGTRRTQLRSRTAYENLQLSSGQSAVCTFRNIRRDSPAIAIDKTGPATAQAGETLSYVLAVTNPGDLPFPAASVRVDDATCDDPPELVGKADASGADDSPRTLDPGDTWTYRCSRKTAAGPDCRTSVVPNTAKVTGTSGGQTVSDRSSIETSLACPPPPKPQPQPPPPPGPSPPPVPPPAPPSPVVPPGPAPPDADDAATAGVIFRQATQGCIRTRVPRVNFEGTRIARVQVFVNGQLRRRLTVQTLQRRVTPRVLLRPGRYRLAVRFTFQRGTGSPSITFRTQIRICGPPRRAQPRFTG